jgi:hypothetical protein
MWSHEGHMFQGYGNDVPRTYSQGQGHMSQGHDH